MRKLLKKLFCQNHVEQASWLLFLQYTSLEQPIQHRVVDQSFKQNQRISGVIRYGLGSDQLPALHPGPFLGPGLAGRGRAGG